MVESEEKAEEMTETEDMAKSEEMAKTEEMAEGEEMMDGMKHTIARGDNYWDLAKKYYSDANMWTKIAEANPDMDANDLEVGAELVIPK